jgi:hypothetical protein
MIFLFMRYRGEGPTVQRTVPLARTDTRSIASVRPSLRNVDVDIPGSPPGLEGVRCEKSVDRRAGA